MTADNFASSQAALVPLLALVGTALCILILDLRAVPRRFSAWVALASLVVAATMALIGIVSEQGGPVQGMLSADGVAALVTLYLCGAGGASILLDLGLPEDSPRRGSGSYALTLFVVAGSLIVAQSLHVLPLTVGLAILHTASSALIGPQKTWQYAVIQGVGLATLLFGAALLYGAVGTLRVDVIAERMGLEASLGAENALALLGSGLVVVGLAVPLAVVPFHTWPDGICRAARAPAGMLIALALPGAAITVLGRLTPALSEHSLSLLSILGSVSLLWGHWYALRSDRVRRALAGIWTAQSGLLFLALTGIPAARWPILCYILASGGLNLMCLWALDVNARQVNGDPLRLKDIQGLGRRRPWLASVMTICLLNVAGMPPLSGWITEVALFRGAVDLGFGWSVGLAIVGIFIAWLVAGRWLCALWMRPVADRAWAGTTPEIAVVAILCAAGVLLAGFYAALVLSGLSALIPVQ